MTMKTIELVTFDLDGTIIDNEWAHERAKTEIAASLGVTGELGLKEYTGHSNHKFWEYICKNANLANEVSLEELVNLQFKKVLTYIKDIGQKETPNLVKTLEYLKENKYKIALTSGSDSYFVDEILDYLNLNCYFDIKVTKNHVQNTKPMPDIYLYAQKLTGVNSNSSLGVEDSKAGCTALKRAGMISVGYTNCGLNPQNLDGADYIVSEMNQLISVLEGLQITI